MKKVLLVLGLGLAMMSCSKEEVVTELPELCYEIIGFSSEVSEQDVLFHYITINKWDGSGTFVLPINEDKWLDYKAEIAEFGFACWGE
tara:strand:- start:314 stop:577 length:264 start_codon:yes stop_codon:yes gene_type:complete